MGDINNCLFSRSIRPQIPEGANTNMYNDSILYTDMAKTCPQCNLEKKLKDFVSCWFCTTDDKCSDCMCNIHEGHQICVKCKDFLMDDICPVCKHQISEHREVHTGFMGVKWPVPIKCTGELTMFTTKCLCQCDALIKS